MPCLLSPGCRPCGWRANFCARYCRRHRPLAGCGLDRLLAVPRPAGGRQRRRDARRTAACERHATPHRTHATTTRARRPVLVVRPRPRRAGTSTRRAVRACPSRPRSASRRSSRRSARRACGGGRRPSSRRATSAWRPRCAPRCRWGRARMVGRSALRMYSLSALNHSLGVHCRVTPMARSPQCCAQCRGVGRLRVHLLYRVGPGAAPAQPACAARARAALAHARHPAPRRADADAARLRARARARRHGRLRQAVALEAGPKSINQPRRVVSASRGRSAPRRARPFRLLMGSGSHACLLSPSGRRGRDFSPQWMTASALSASHCVGRRRRRPSLARGGACVFFASTFAGVFFAHPFDWVQGGASQKTIEHIADEGEASCCFDRGDCSSRRHWRDLKEPEARPAVAVVVSCSPRPSVPLPARSLHDARPVGGLLYGTRVSLRE